MSIYSGFATRQQEQTYDENIATILYLMQKRLNKFYAGETINEKKFTDLIIKVYNNLKSMEQSKYLQPKLSTCISQFVQTLKVKKQEIEMKQDKKQQICKKQSIQTKPASNSKVVLQSIPDRNKGSLQKLTITERAAFMTDKKFQSDVKPTTVVKKRVASNIHHKSFIASTVSHRNLNSSESQIRKVNIQETPKSKELQSIKKDKAKKRNDMSSDKKIEPVEKIEEKQDVRELIKGYLVKKKRQHGKDLEYKRQQFKEIFQQF